MEEQRGEVQGAGWRDERATEEEEKQVEPVETSWGRVEVGRLHFALTHAENDGAQLLLGKNVGHLLERAEGETGGEGGDEKQVTLGWKNQWIKLKILMRDDAGRRRMKRKSRGSSSRLQGRKKRRSLKKNQLNLKKEKKKDKKGSAGGPAGGRAGRRETIRCTNVH